MLQQRKQIAGRVVLCQWRVAVLHQQSQLSDRIVGLSCRIRNGWQFKRQLGNRIAAKDDKIQPMQNRTIT